ncbi:PP2C family serine/threonine-protein phosphatase [Bacillus sp. B15-48]|uniref:PP2C family serine/threonine-protein phosphatase n=1 Tax=Bacillus sp. B15-48 TaxID=1548601 RepID=UPI0019400ADB|nr:PP2C family serine/threonine-protein phosphatase [Bacillus sp. B15-48]MBM4765377.1 SpoIIE family protein phosphatase [Bacillus sp. B15-48]
MIEIWKNKIELLAYQTTKDGNTECGDSYYYIATDEYFICVLADGLGSGKYANESSVAVVETVEQYHHKDVDTIMDLCNRALFHKRGAAVSVLKVFFSRRKFEYSAVGNIRFFLYSPDGKLTYPLPVTGFLSGKPQVFHTQQYSYEPESKFLLYSDGFDIHGVKALLSSFKSTQLIGDELKRDFKNTGDDATFILGSLL